jgi:rod shape-determining protein MreB
MKVKGRDLRAGVPKTIDITSEEVREALNEPITLIVDSIKQTLERTPPELAADIVDNGIVLTGGGALLGGLDTLIKEETGLPVNVAEDPLTCVVLGSGKALDELDLLKEVSIW